MFLCYFFSSKIDYPHIVEGFLETESQIFNVFKGKIAKKISVYNGSDLILSTLKNCDFCLIYKTNKRPPSLTFRITKTKDLFKAMAKQYNDGKEGFTEGSIIDRKKHTQTLRSFLLQNKLLNKDAKATNSNKIADIKNQMKQAKIFNKKYELESLGRRLAKLQKDSRVNLGYKKKTRESKPLRRGAKKYQAPHPNSLAQPLRKRDIITPQKVIDLTNPNVAWILAQQRGVKRVYNLKDPRDFSALMSARIEASRANSLQKKETQMARKKRKTTRAPRGYYVTSLGEIVRNPRRRVKAGVRARLKRIKRGANLRKNGILVLRPGFGKSTNTRYVRRIRKGVYEYRVLPRK